MRFLTKLFNRLTPVMKFLYTIWNKASQLFMLFSNATDEREPGTSAVLSRNFQCTLNDRLENYEKQIDDSFDSLLSRIKLPDNMPSSSRDGDRKFDEFSSARRKEFIKTVNSVREVIRNDFRNDISRLISSKYSTDVDIRHRDFTSESFDEMVQLFKQLKLTDSSVTDHQNYSDVIDPVGTLKLSDKDSKIDAIQLLENKLNSTYDRNVAGNNESADDDVIEVVKDSSVVVVNSSDDDDSSSESETKGNSGMIFGNSLIEQKSTFSNESVSIKSHKIKKDDVIEAVKDIKSLTLNPSNDDDSRSEMEIEEKFNPMLGNSSAVEQNSISSIEDDLKRVVKDIESLVLNSSDDDDSSSEIVIEENFNPILGNSSFRQTFISDSESVSEKSFSSIESEISVPEGDAFKSLIENLSFSKIFSPSLLANNRKSTAIEFTNFMVDRRLITIESRLSELELQSMYDTYEAEANPEISIADQLLPVLRSNGIVKRNVTLSDENNNEVEFKEIVFLNRNDEVNVDPSEVPFKGKVIRTLNPGYFSRGRPFYCSVCKDCFHTKDIFDNHNISEIHILKTIHLRNKSWFVENVDYLKITGIPDQQLDLGETKTYEISFTNISENANKAYIWKIFEMVNFGEDMRMEYGPNFCLEKGDSFKINMKVKFTDISATEKMYPIVLKVSQNDVNEYSFILIEPHFKVVRAAKRINCAIRNLKSYRPPLKSQNNIQNEKYSIVGSSETSQLMVSGAFKAFHRNKNRSRKNVAIANCRIQKNTLENIQPKPDDELLNKENEEEVEILHAPRISRAKKIPKLILPESSIPSVLHTLLKSRFKMTDFQCSLREKEELKNITKLLFEAGTLKLLHNKDVLTEHNYIDRLRHEMWIEEYHILEELRSFTQKDIDLLTDRLPENLIGISLSGLSEGRPSLMRGDIIFIKSKSTTFPVGYVKCEGCVQVIEEKAVYVKLHKTFYAERYWRYKADVEFRFNRNPLRMSHTILETLRGYKWQKSLYPTTFDERPNNVQLKSFFNESVARNELQVQAVTNIVQNRAFPAPYILFGPPGTGKTSTLVEAIAQVWSTMESSRICVCASSNSAADVIAKRLLQYIPLSDIIRIYGLSRNDADIISELQDCSNYDPRIKEIFFPNFAELKSKRIIVMTPVTAGRFILNGFTFDYVFMDEAGHTLEVEVLIPFSGFLRSNRCSMVLAGDPKQLGPVVRSRYATDLGYGMSLLERLMTQCEIYKKDPVTGKYNPKVITKLVKNYRSHSKILNVCNVQFYDNELEATAPENLISCLCLWEELPAKGFPIIFRSVKGTEERENNSPSYFNVFEVNVVHDYVSKLLNSKDKKLDPSEIGIISPYRKQVQKIRQRLSQTWSKINVASVEEFQGQERKVIIISTVRSRHELVATDYKYGLGFLKNEKRFNVAITRAMALLIVVGNPDILQCDPNWREFLKYCSDHSAFVGEPASGTLPEDFGIHV